ncbi:DUF4153 domain-containing protein [Pedobacter nyackensis]|uniref:Uncharacterized protein n=1 Tax=Pedobacter nyackensis TaxID=475255 RepID=A0A1W2CG57_9SPHI|nr:DUF4173 domain-containing protein [Pedobacter nyackensis]SMC84046.1 protein of unknown function [Pedobacter nyackensis]
METTSINQVTTPMKLRIDLQLISTLAGGILFSLLFWMEKQALNLLIYSLFILVIILLDPEKRKNKKLYLSCGAHLLAAILVVINQSILTIITWYISLAIMVGFVHFQLLRSVFTSLLAAFLQFITAPLNLVKKMMTPYFKDFSFKPVFQIIKYIFIPFIALLFFSVLYSANPIFSNYMNQITSSIGDLIDTVFYFFFDDLSFLRLMHLILGMLITAAVFISLKGINLERFEASFSEQLIRRRRDQKNNSFVHEIIAVFAGSILKRTMALKTENIIGILSFLVLNLLLLSLNVIDVSSLWLGKDESLKSASYSAELHDGTNALILSIIMAMLVILYFFRGNLNFYQKNKTIRVLAYLWIAQNIFLISSVLIRDFNYINALGLTYKRIGVLIFLLLCTIGLITVYLKVAKQKTLFYLCKVNGFVWYVLLPAFGFVNWDASIVRYNINNRNTTALDLDHLLSFSDKTLPLLNENKQLLSKYLNNSSYAYEMVYDTTTQRNIRKENTDMEQLKGFEKDLNRRIDNFKETYKRTTWRSWNYRDWKTQQYLVKNRLSH